MQANYNKKYNRLIAKSWPKQVAMIHGQRKRKSGGDRTSKVCRKACCHDIADYMLMYRWIAIHYTCRLKDSYANL